MRINFKSMAKAHLLRWNASDLRKTLVNELGRDHGMLCFEGISSCQIVILACIDNDPSSSVDTAGEELIDKRAFHINIAKDNTIESGVNNHIKTHLGTHSGNFG